MHHFNGNVHTRALRSFQALIITSLIGYDNGTDRITNTLTGLSKIYLDLWGHLQWQKEDFRAK